MSVCMVVANNIHQGSCESIKSDFQVGASAMRHCSDADDRSGTFVHLRQELG